MPETRSRPARGLLAGVLLLSAIVPMAFLDVGAPKAQSRPDSKPAGIKGGGPGGETRTSGRPKDFDFSGYDLLLKKYVRNGLVDYAAWKKDGIGDLELVLKAMADHPYSGVLARESRLSFLINSYNAYTLKSILLAYPVESVMDIPGFFDKTKHPLHGGQYTLDEIEKTLIKAKFSDKPEYHLAIVCGGMGCPPLRNQAYMTDSLAIQLGSQVHDFFADPARSRFDEKTGVLHLSELFEWYRDDFETGDRTLAAYVAPNFSLGFALKLMKENPKIEFIPFDWKLNDAGSK